MTFGMSTSTKRLKAEQFYETGFFLFQEQRYEQSLIELRRAEDAFRKLDARGHPFNHPLPNGVTGHANALALSGRCHQQLGNIEKAVACFETSMINARFERSRPFESFVAAVQQDMLACYARELEKIDPSTRQDVLKRDIRLDPSYRFPFSLSKEAVPLARLYELDPHRYPQFRDFYLRAKAADVELRRTDKESGDSGMKKAGVYLWLIMGSLWAVYSLIVASALFIK